MNLPQRAPEAFLRAAGMEAKENPGALRGSESLCAEAKVFVRPGRGGMKKESARGARTRISSAHERKEKSRTLLKRSSRLFLMPVLQEGFGY